jgi:hypothetical protein
MLVVSFAYFLLWFYIRNAVIVHKSEFVTILNCTRDRPSISILRKNQDSDRGLTNLQKGLCQLRQKLISHVILSL